MKRPELVVWSSDPLLVETPLELLRESPLTPTELFYIRNHGPVPTLVRSTHRVRVVGLVRTPLELSVDDLVERFPTVTVEATLACAGNRRAELAAARPIPGETPWGAGAIGNARWTGVRLGDVLDAAGVPDGAAHVAFEGDDATAEAAEFGASVPLAKAFDDVVLAHSMNGEPLLPEHGFPLRVVVPGYIGARSVKWLTSVVVQEQPSANHFQARGYRLLPPWGANGDRGLALGEFSLTSVVCSARVSGGTASLAGYALAGGGRTVERVEASLDGGRTWAGARLDAPRGPWSWRFWEIDLALAPGRNEVAVRAFDSAANTQPEDAATLWNAKGYMNNAWHRTVLEA